MGTPFTNAVQHRTSKEAPDRPIEPRPEAYEGFNNPYRGVNDHGVPMEYDVLPPIVHGDDTENYEPAPEPIAPIPVTVVNSKTGRDRHKLRTFSFYANGSSGSSPMLGLDRTRTKLTLVCTGANVRIATEPISSGDAPHKSAAIENMSLTLETHEPIYVLWNGSGDGGYISVIVEYTMPEDFPA